MNQLIEMLGMGMDTITDREKARLIRSVLKLSDFLPLIVTPSDFNDYTRGVNASPKVVRAVTNLTNQFAYSNAMTLRWIEVQG